MPIYTAPKKSEKNKDCYKVLCVYYGSIIFGNKEVGQKCVWIIHEAVFPCLFPVPKQETGLPQYPGIWATNWVIQGSSDCQLLWLARRSITFDRFRICAPAFLSRRSWLPLVSRYCHFLFNSFLPNMRLENKTPAAELDRNFWKRDGTEISGKCEDIKYLFRIKKKWKRSQSKLLSFQSKIYKQGYIVFGCTIISNAKHQRQNIIR